jgi:chromate transporter
MFEGRVVQLLLVFVPLSLLSVGGGQSVVTDMHRQVVDVHHWLTEAQFVADYAISRTSPGPGSLLVTVIGWQVAGWPGALAATFGIFVPSSVLVYGLARVWARHRGARWVRAVEQGLAPVAAGMMLAATFTLFRAQGGNWLGIGLGLATAGVALTTRINPLVMVAVGAVLFLIRG